MEFVYPIYKKENIEKMRSALWASKNSLRNVLFFEISLETALRSADIFALRKKDVIDGIVSGRSTKKDKPFQFRLTDKTLELIKLYTANMKDEQKMFPMSRITAHRFIKEAADVVGIEENISVHSIRKTKAYHMYRDNKNDLNLVMTLLQHDNVRSTLRYIGVSQEELENALQSHVL